MKKIREVKEMFESSLREMFVTRNMVLCGLMAALAVVLSMTASIEVGPYIRIGFGNSQPDCGMPFWAGSRMFVWRCAGYLEIRIKTHWPLFLWFYFQRDAGGNHLWLYSI